MALYCRRTINKGGSGIKAELLWRNSKKKGATTKQFSVKRSKKIRNKDIQSQVCNDVIPEAEV